MLKESKIASGSRTGYQIKTRELTSMIGKIFNKIVFVVVLVVFLVAVVLKVYSSAAFPRVSNLNYRDLKKIDGKKEQFSFAVFGDNKNSIRTFEELMSKLNKEDALFAVDCGDLVYDGEEERFRFFINQIRHLDKPLLTVAGNHEVTENGRANYHQLFGRFYYSFAVGKSYFIVLDDSNEKSIDAKQMAWLQKELRIGQAYQNRFVFMHVPLYDPRKGMSRAGHSLSDLKSARKLNGLFDRNNVTMLFTSHIHAYYRGRWGNTPYIITGGAGAELAGSDPRHYFYHYIKTDVSEGNVTYRVVKIGNADSGLAGRWAHTAWIYVYAYLAIHYWDLLIVAAVIYMGAYAVLRIKESLNEAQANQS
jgi:hypothetical protein